MSNTLTNRADRLEEIRQIVSDILEIDPAEMTQTSLFKEDHDADSLRAIEILASLEKKFGVQIPQSSLAEMVNLDGVYGVVAKSAGWND